MRCAFIFYNAKDLPDIVKLHETLIQATGALVVDEIALTWEEMAQAIGGF
jgi:hypothetical protein